MRQCGANAWDYNALFGEAKMKGPYIKVIKLDEAGYNSALHGLRLSYDSKIERMPRRALILSNRLETGEAKFLEHIELWFEVAAPRYFWQEADTYRISSKQSESTMHTLNKLLKAYDEYLKTSYALRDQLVHDNFEGFYGLDNHIDNLHVLWGTKVPFWQLKAALPEGFIQTREWHFSYKTLAHIILQRKDHKLPHWDMFINLVKAQVEHPELLP